LLEISSSGIREILTPEKAELCGLIAAEGSLSPYEGESRQIFFHSADMELIERYIELFEKVYNKTPHIYRGKGEFMAGIKNKEAYDLREIGAKTGPYRYHVPLEHLDEDGIKEGFSLETEALQSMERIRLNLEYPQSTGIA